MKTKTKTKTKWGKQTRRGSSCARHPFYRTIYDAPARVSLDVGQFPLIYPSTPHPIPCSTPAQQRNHHPLRPAPPKSRWR